MSIELQRISKRFGSTQALSEITLTLEEGHIYGLLGNNGAGKTTLLSIITDRLIPDGGKVLIDEEPVRNNDHALEKAFFVGEQNYLPQNIRIKRAFATMEIFFPSFDRAYAEDVAKQFGLKLRKKISSLSTGYASIFRLILGLSVNTPYLLFDEPVLGLDAQHRELFYRLLIEKFSQGKTTILLSTHLIAEIERLIDHTLILREGRLLENAPTEELMSGTCAISGPAGLVDEYVAGKKVLATHTLGGLKTVSLKDETEDPLPPGLERSRMSLQDYFISLQDAEDVRAERKEESGYAS